MVRTNPLGVPPEVTKPPEAFAFNAAAVTTPVPSASHAITVVAELTMKHGAVDPTTVVVPGVIEDAAAVMVCQVAAVPLVAVNT